jgi:NTE family protein
VLAGGGARGAYEIGALSVLLPLLEQRGERPEVIIGTSVGAINASFLAATAGDPVEESLEQARTLWEQLGWDDVLRPLLSPAELVRLGALVIPGARVWGLLDPAPLAAIRSIRRAERPDLGEAIAQLEAVSLSVGEVQDQLRIHH